MSHLFLNPDDSLDPSWNLAVEEHLLATETTHTLFRVWQNSESVIVGRHQWVDQEVNIRQAKQWGIPIYRRGSGGGSVFHDRGNLNVTVIIPKPARYSLTQIKADLMAPLQSALLALGIPSEYSDQFGLLANGRKFSGVAQRVTQNKILQHYTALIHTDLGKLQELVMKRNVSSQTKPVGTQSRVHPVINLSELSPGITVDRLRSALIEQWKSQSQGTWGEFSLSENDRESIGKLQEKYRSDEWNLEHLRQ